MAPAPPRPAEAADPAARWLTELHTHPTHHDLLAAFDLLHKTTQPLHRPPNLSQSPADHAHDLSPKPSHTHDLSPKPPHHHPHDLSPKPSHHHSHDLSPTPSHHNLHDLPEPPTDPIRFTHSTALALPLAELLAVTRDPDDPNRHLLTTAGPGPCGPASPLPLALADELADDPLALAVLDLFHHRRTLLLCRALLAADLAGALDTHRGADPWSQHLIALVGLTTAPLTPLEALRLAPLLASADRSPRALALALHRLLPDLLPDRVTQALRLEPVAHAWTPFADEHHSRLGSPAARLGDTAALGTELRLPSAAARLHLGPLPGTAVDALRPGQPAHARLRALLAIFIPEPIALELVVELEDMSLPPCLLGQQSLGRDLFLTPDPAAHRPHRLTIPLTCPLT